MAKSPSPAQAALGGPFGRLPAPPKAPKSSAKPAAPPKITPPKPADPKVVAAPARAEKPSSATSKSPRVSFAGVSGTAKAGSKGAPVKGSVTVKPSALPRITAGARALSQQEKQLTGRSASPSDLRWMSSGPTVGGTLLHTTNAVTGAVGAGGRWLNNAVTNIRQTIGHATGLGPPGNPRGGDTVLATLSPSATLQRVGINTLKDLVDVPAEIPVSTYLAGRALVHAAEGRPQELAQMGKQTLRSLTTVGGWEQHPLANALMVAGGISGIGKAGDVALRAIGKGSDLARPDIVAYGNARVRQLPYSKDPLIRAREKAADSRPMSAHRANNVSAKMVDQLYGTAQTVWRNTRGRVLEERQHGITDRRSIGAQLRQARKNAANPAEPLLHPEIRGKEAVNLALQGVIRRPDTMVEDLRKYRSLIEKHPAEKGTAEEARQHAMLSHIDALLNNKHVLANGRQVFEAARKAASDLNAQQPQLVSRGLVNQAAAERVPLLQYAELHMGGERGLTPEARAHDAARQAVSAAQRRVNQTENSLHAAMSPEQHTTGLALLESARRTLKAAQEKERALKVPQDQREALLHPAAHENAGHVITNDEIRAHMRANGVNPEHVAYITHLPTSEEHARYGAMSRHPLAGKKHRTMRSFEGGQFDPTHDAVVRQHLMGELKIHRHETMRRIINSFVLRKGGTELPTKGLPHGDFKTFGEAQKAANDAAFRAAHNVPEGVKLRPFRITPQFAGKAQMTAIKAGLDTHEAAFDPAQFESAFTPIHDALRQPTSGEEPGAWGLISDTVARRLEEHEKADNKLLRMAGTATSLFRRAVLPYSAKRIAGVPQETALRLVVGRAGASSRLVAGRVLASAERQARADPEVRRQLDWMTGQLFGGTQSGQAMRLSRYTPDNTYAGYPFEGMPALVHGLKRTPAIGHVAETYNFTSRKILGWYKKGIEAQGQKFAFGKAALKDLEQKTGAGWPRALMLQQKAIDDFTKGILNSPNQDMFARYLDQMMGKWSNQSPLFNDLLKFSPFLSWYVNSIKFIYGTLPLQHPVVSGLIAASHVGTSAERTKLGESGPISGNPLEVAGYQESAIPLSPTQRLQLSYYTPFSTMGDVAGSLADQFMPQYTPAFLGLGGVDYTFQPPKNAQGRRVALSVPDKIKLAFEGTLGTISPLQAILRLDNPSQFSQWFRVYYPVTEQPQSSSSSLGGGSLGGGSLSGGSLGGGPLG